MKNTSEKMLELDKLNFFPLAHRVTSRTIAMDLVTVQPMEAPSGLVFFDSIIGTFKLPIEKRIKKTFKEYFLENETN